MGTRARLHQRSRPLHRRRQEVLHHSARQQHRDFVGEGRIDPKVRRVLSFLRPVAYYLARSRRHVSLLKIQGREFQMEPIRLRSVRPFVWDEVSLLVAQDVDNVELDTKVKVNRFLKLKVSSGRCWSVFGQLLRGSSPR